MNTRLLEKNDYSLGGLLFTPLHTQDAPLIIYLHGAGERGENKDHLYKHGIPKLISEGREYPAIILCPQCPAEFVWNNVVRELKAMIDKVVEEYSIKPDRISITGSSMGGFGTWEMALTYTALFAAAAPVAGGGLSWRTPNLRKTPIFAYHGSIDNAVPPIYSELMVNSTNRSGGKAELVILENLGHNDGIDYAYRNTDLIEKLINARRTDFESVPEFLSSMF